MGAGKAAEIYYMIGFTFGLYLGCEWGWYLYPHRPFFSALAGVAILAALRFSHLRWLAASPVRISEVKEEE